MRRVGGRESGRILGHGGRSRSSDEVMYLAGSPGLRYAGGEFNLGRRGSCQPTTKIAKDG
jgi:hypothetical protein